VRFGAGCVCVSSPPAPPASRSLVGSLAPGTTATSAMRLWRAAGLVVVSEMAALTMALEGRRAARDPRDALAPGDATHGARPPVRKAAALREVTAVAAMVGGGGRRASRVSTECRCCSGLFVTGADVVTCNSATLVS